MALLTIEIFLGGVWRPAAALRSSRPEAEALGFGGPCWLEYDATYAVEQLGRSDRAALSVCHPVSFDLRKGEHWPAFLLDLIPSGHARRVWLGRLGIADGPTADWSLMLNGAGYPPGNLRIREAVAAPPPAAHPGFDLQEVFDRHEAFIEYAEQTGASVAGSSGAQGDAPKLLLTRDRDGRWHADGVLPDGHAADHWLVKFPRGKRESDRLVLRLEAAYMKVAAKVGLHVHPRLPEWRQDALLISRFDRRAVAGGVERHGLESLVSAAGIAEFGAVRRHEAYCETIARHSTRPAEDLLEYLRRDLLNFALGNTDNHGRNTALLKAADDEVRLSPLYDFAPMFLDDQGIARVTRWERTFESPGHSPDWLAIAGELESRFGAAGLRERMGAWVDVVARLPEAMLEAGVDAPVVERRRGAIAECVLRLRGED
ncbi:type II toxin-antitoxin system HipA family toxin [Endothiovibrio diazotrophicus]